MSSWEAPATRIQSCWVFDGLRTALLCAPEFVVSEGVIMGREFGHSSQGTKVLVVAAAAVVAVAVTETVVVLAAVVMRVAAATCAMPFRCVFEDFCNWFHFLGRKQLFELVQPLCS